MGSKGGSAPKNITQTTVATPWEKQAPYLRFAYDTAKNLYPYSDVVPWSPETQAGMSLTTSRALAGSPVLYNAQQNAADTLGGSYLFGGPAWNAAYNAAANQIIPGVESRWEGAGRYGSGLGRAAETQALGDAFAGLYDNERQRQMAAMGMAPGLAEADYSDIQKLLGVGQSREALAQQQASLPWTNLQRAMQIFGGVGAPGGTTSQSQPNPYASTSSPLAGALGGALSGAGLASALGGGVGTLSTLGSGATIAGAAGAMNPLMWPLIIAGGLLGSRG